MRTVRIGTRTSALAIRQTELVAEALKKIEPDLDIRLIPLKTRGDQILDTPLVSFGGKGAFVTEFEQALLSGEIDLAVHSGKDLPARLADGLCIYATPKRADARDVLVLQRHTPIDALTRPVIGTSSLRREVQIRGLMRAKVKLLRGNVPTRLKRLKNGEYDGILLAAAGLERLGMNRDLELEYRYFSPEEMVPAAAQGIIAVEGRAGDLLQDFVKQISDQQTALEFKTERYILEKLNAGCHEAVGVFSQVENDHIVISLMTVEGGSVRKRQISGSKEDYQALADALLQQKPEEEMTEE